MRIIYGGITFVVITGFVLALLLFLQKAIG
jgi:hypothetical protein